MRISRFIAAAVVGAALSSGAQPSEPREIECPIALAGSLGTVWRGDVTASRIRLAPNEAAVFEVK